MKERKSFVLRGTIIYSESMTELKALEDGYVVCESGVCSGVYETLPDRYSDLTLKDLSGYLIIPGLVDLHVHASQYPFRGLGMDMELLEWLNVNAFPEEARYGREPAYADRAYDMFVRDMKRGATTRAVVFATADVDSTVCLMEKLETSGLMTYVGKVNMDRNVADYYIETTEGSLLATEEWLEKAAEREFANTCPVITPRFTPSCSDELMKGLGQIAEKYDLPVQSHLNENPSEVELVAELCPDAGSYSDTYARYGLFGKGVPTVMAHCIYNTDEEVELMRENGVFVAHCPQSNMNIASGIAPVRRLLEAGVRVGLGSDVAGGSETSIFAAMKDAIRASKLNWRLVDKDADPLTLPEVFYMATAGGGQFFGKVGTFREGYEFDAVVLDDSSIETTRDLTPIERLERVVYCSDDRNVKEKYVRGSKV